MIPPIHNAYGPTFLDISDTIGSMADISIFSTPANIINEQVEVVSPKNTVDIQKYVQSLMKESQSIAYYVAVNGVSYGRYVATHSATQIAKSNDLSGLVGKVLTDFETIDVYDGYPRPVSVLSKAGIINYNL